MIPDARELHRVITASVRELLETVRLEQQAGMVDDAQLERVIFRAAAPIVHSLSSLTDAQRGELLYKAPSGSRAAAREAGRIGEANV